MDIQDKVEHIPSWMAKNKLNLHIGKPEFVQFLSCLDESGRMTEITMYPAKSVKTLGVHLDKNLNFEVHVQSANGKTANYVSVVMRLRHFCKR